LLRSATKPRDDASKADRYIAKLRVRFPAIRVIERGEGPVKDTVYVKITPPAH
jgi:hypothetical protein